MTMSIQGIPYGTELARMVASAKHEVRISSPFITAEGAKYVRETRAPMRIITKVTGANLSGNGLHSPTLKQLLGSGVQIRSIPNLHAKIYLLDESEGLVTSSNLTGPGLLRNVEVGLRFADEPNLFHAVSVYFESLWQKAVPVTISSLEEVEGKVAKSVYVGGIWAPRDVPQEATAESQVPVPAIGYLELVPVESSSVAKQPDGQQIGADAGVSRTPTEPTADESGDYFGFLPDTAEGLVEDLSDQSSQVVQITLNTVELTAPSEFKKWLESLAPEDLTRLIKISTPYPYKTYVIAKIVRDAAVQQLATLVSELVSDPGNENQLLKYYQLIQSRVQALGSEEGERFALAAEEISQRLLTLVAPSTLARKNFARPNLDRVLGLLGSSDAPPAFVSVLRGEAYSRVVAADVPAEQRRVPSYQEIRRTREMAGDDFWFQVDRWFPDILDGRWGSTPSSLLALFKELRKVRLSAEQAKKVSDTAVSVQRQLDQEAAVVRNTLIVDIRQHLQMHSQGMSSGEREQWSRAIQELSPSRGRAVQATGRLVDLYGKAMKSGALPRNDSIKSNIDYLSTYLTVRSALEYWSQNQ